MTPPEMARAIRSLEQRVKALERGLPKSVRPKIKLAYYADLEMAALIKMAVGLFAVETLDIIGARSLAPFVLAREWVAYEAHLLGKSSVEIGRALNRDHSTVLHYLAKERVRRGVARNENEG